MFSCFFLVYLHFPCLAAEKNEPGGTQLGSQTTDQDFAKIHKDVNFNKEDKEKMHGVGMETEGGGHGMGAHGKKEKPDPSKVIATVNNEKFSVRIWIKSWTGSKIT